MKEFDYYIFDFDGTLVDTTEGITKSVQYALQTKGIDETDIGHLNRFIGPPLYDSFRDFYGMDDADAKALVESYRERYRETASRESALYPGIAELLGALKAKGKIVAVASSKPRLFVEQIAAYHGIDRYFDFIAAESFDHLHSSKQELIEAVLSHFGVSDKTTALMTGDRCYDIAGAKAAGVPSAGAVYGFGEEEELTQSGADFLLYTPDELLR